MKNFAMQWQDKKVCFLGDSITDGIGVTKDTVYWSLLSKELGMKAYGYGLNGSKFLALLNQAKAMLEEHKTDVDAIFVFAGTNDFYGNIPLGNWYIESERTVLKSFNTENGEIKETRKFREFNFDTTTFRGSINTVLSFLKENYPDKQIVLMTPIHRAFATFGPENVQYDEMYSNSIGVFFDEYVAAVKEAANVWATELIDLNAVSGFFPLYDKNAEKYFCNTETDRLHPNFEGHIRLAKLLEKKLTSIDV